MDITGIRVVSLLLYKVCLMDFVGHLEAHLMHRVQNLVIRGGEISEAFTIAKLGQTSEHFPHLEQLDLSIVILYGVN